jgi:pimeloyl-ACP methyl ester carboxylesterase
MMIEVGGVRLHCLEWGEGGEPMVLVPGLGQSAHVYRALGPALASDRRVVAVTPRAHGESATPAGGYTVADFAAELRGAMDALGMERATLVAHSVSGAVATRLAADHPERVRAVVYLDGIYDYAGREDMVSRNPFPPPPRPFFGTAAENRAWLRGYVTGGSWSEALDADLAARRGLGEESHRLELLARLVQDVIDHPHPVAGVRCPALALIAGEDVGTQFPWLDPADTASRQRAETYLHNVRTPWRRTAVERFRWEAPHGRVVEIAGGHWFFLSARDRVVDEIRAFLHTPSADPT